MWIVFLFLIICDTEEVLCGYWCYDSEGLSIFARLIYGVYVNVEERGDVNSNEIYLYASKHLSALDSIALLTILQSPSFILKKQLLWVPVIGWYMRKFGVVAIDRGNTSVSGVKDMLLQTRVKIDEKRSIIIYPEGTRDKARQKYQTGIFYLYKSLQLPVRPISLNSDAVWGVGLLGFRTKNHHQKLQVIMQPPIMPGLDKESFMHKLESSIENKEEGL